ncbi:hypothetical protein BZM27_12545 [Paraburkholderia steynii]|uniref:Uncharacterized protein n=1 Tax=Paraburkholderia steynii TaxID=1245441 RepID=A0A4V2NHD1_9BURK|nr:hypothetical protein BZM27_12545 [Paraburkholderia steynii]
MKVLEIFELMGGRPYIMRLTDLQAARLSLMATKNHIPSHWVRLFIALRPELDWTYLLDSDSPKFMEIRANSFIRDLRAQRMREAENPRVAEMEP